MIRIDDSLAPRDLLPAVSRLWELSAAKIRALEGAWDPGRGAPVFTVEGTWTTRGWTEWTQGFQFGSALLQFDATGETSFLDLGRERTFARMVDYVTHRGVHDHGFNVVSTYGNLWRLGREGRIPEAPAERAHLELALRCSGAVQAARWTPIAGGGGFIHSFNGPHSLFADTLRTLRSLALSHRLGHVLKDEGDREVSLLARLVHHADATAAFVVFYGEGRDVWDERGRVAHESLFNPADGQYRCPATQQGYSPFTTWTRGQAWVLLGFAEELEFLDTLDPSALEPFGGAAAVVGRFRRAAEAVADHYLDTTPTDGVPYWDTGAPGLARLPGHRERPSDPMNGQEPVDSSAAAIAAQGLLRLGRWLEAHGEGDRARRCGTAGLTVARTLLGPQYLSEDPRHQGLLLHSVYHRPRGWDHVPPGSTVPRGESSQWGDYHLRELALLVQRLAGGGPYPAFFGPV